MKFSKFLQNFAEIYEIIKFHSNFPQISKIDSPDERIIML
jgi:hypothetical protein